MTPEIFMKELTALWPTYPLKAAGRLQYELRLQGASSESLEQALKTLGTECHYFPKLSEVMSWVAFDQGLESETECNYCKGSTWLYVTQYHPETRASFQAVKPCSCTPRSIKNPMRPKLPPLTSSSAHLPLGSARPDRQ